VGDRLIVNRLENVQTRLTIHALDGTVEREIELPTIGTAGVASGPRDATEIFYTFTSFTYPPTIYRHDLTDGSTDIFRQPEYPFDPEDYRVSQVFYTSADGTRVPMFIVHRADVVRDGSNPTYLYAYGGFNVSITPSFSASNLAWLERGGVYAVANIRGGGEFGRAWHEAGILQNRPRVFEDFIAAAEHLIDEGYTSSEHLGIGGGSNGGLLVGAVMTQRPELFGAAVPAVGVLDMLRFHKFTIGWAWVSDYGSPDDPEMFEVLRGYSPLHNLAEGTSYPATLVLTADHDDRVVPAHSFKFAAALQHAHAGDAPVLIRIEERAGHGAGTPTSMIIERHADMWAFLEHTLRPAEGEQL
jgi:prolyl oligopeptidase